jgi:hypothetical protein
VNTAKYISGIERIIREHQQVQMLNPPGNPNGKMRRLTMKGEHMNKRDAGLVALRALITYHHCQGCPCGFPTRECPDSVGRAYRVVRATLCPAQFPRVSDQAPAVQS